MISAEGWMEISVLNKHGMSIRGIAEATGLSRNTVRRYLRGGEAAAACKPAAKRREKLDPFKDSIIERLQAAAPDAIPAVVLFREIRARGYEGGETRVKDLVRGLRFESKPDPVVRFETEPGCQMQADWASVGRGHERLKVFIATLGWSRATFIRFCADERLSTLIDCHERAFAAFGGVPKEVFYDNMKTVVSGAERLWPRCPPRSSRLSRLCPPRRGDAAAVPAVPGEFGCGGRI